jgi:hypothetical protein
MLIVSKNRFADIVIEPTGYCVMRHINHYTWDTDKDDNITKSVMIRVNSVYNDKICERILHSQFKLI